MLRRTRRRALRAVVNTSADAAAAMRRRAFIARTRAAAIAAHATVDLSVHPEAEVGRDVRVTFEPWSHNLLHVGPRSTLGDRLLINLHGGEVRVGDLVRIRRDCVFNVAGELVLDGDQVISWGTVFHCNTRVHLERMVIVGEYTTFADSSHRFTEPDAPILHNVRSGSIDVGRNTWIAAHAVVTRDAKIGSHCIVAAGSVVAGEVPSGSLASGVPATVRPLSLPW